MMQLQLLFSRWSRIASLLLIGGALAWIIKLAVIVATNGRIITSGPAAFFMTAGLLLLLIGSTGVGARLSAHRNLLLRIVAILLSPALVIGLCLLFNMITSPLVKYSSLWYAQQEAPIAVAALVNLCLGLLLYRTYKPIAG